MKGLFRQFEAIDARAQEMKKGVCREIFMELDVHSRIEEELFYPALYAAYMQRKDESGCGKVQASMEDHKQLSERIDELETLDTDQEDFNQRFGELIHLVEDHIATEESDLLVEAEKLIGDMEGLGARMRTRKAELLTSPIYQGAHPAEVQNPHGGEQMRKQAA